MGTGGGARSQSHDALPAGGARRDDDRSGGGRCADGITQCAGSLIGTQVGLRLRYRLRARLRTSWSHFSHFRSAAVAVGVNFSKFGPQKEGLSRVVHPKREEN